MALLEHLLRTSRTWALVDGLAANVAGDLADRGPELAAVLDRWARDEDFWLRRAAMLALLRPLRRDDGAFERFAGYADAMLEEKEFFIRKAIGWVLRETGRRHPDLVAAWLAPRVHRASGVTVREAVKPLPADVRATLLAGYRDKRPVRCEHEGTDLADRTANRGGTMSDVRIAVSGGDLRCYLARPAGSGPWPGVLVLHDALGMTPDLRAQAEWLAGAGYLALAPDLYSTGSKLRCLVSTFRELAAGQGQVFAKADACRSWLAGQEDCTGHVGVIGYCMGGGFALLLAPGHGFEAASANYGMVPKNAAEFFRQSCPVVGSYGGRDRTLRGAAGKLTVAARGGRRRPRCQGVPRRRALVPQRPPGALATLRGAAGREAALPRVFAAFTAITGPVMGMGSHEPSAADARRRIVEFFDQHLKV